MAFTLAYLTSLNKPTGAGIHASIMLDALAERDDVDVVAVQAHQTGYSKTFTDDDGAYPWVYPNDMRQALIDIDPDIVYVHVFSTHLFSILEDLKESGDLDAKFVLRNGTNTFEQWIGRALGSPRELSSVAEVVWGYDWWDAIVCPSATMAEELEYHYGDDCPPLLHIPNVIRLKDYVPTTFMQDDRLKIVVASRIVPNNYVALPVMAMRRLYGEVDVEMHVFGGGNDPLIATLRRLAGDMEDIEFHGQQDRQVVIDHLQGADVACVPSLSHSAVPYAVLEGLASGCIVLATDCAVMSEEEAAIRLQHDYAPGWYYALRDIHDDREAATEQVRKSLTAARQYDANYLVPEVFVPSMQQVLSGKYQVMVSAGDVGEPDA